MNIESNKTAGVGGEKEEGRIEKKIEDVRKRNTKAAQIDEKKLYSEL